MDPQDLGRTQATPAPAAAALAQATGLPAGYAYTYKRLDIQITETGKVLRSNPFTLDKSIEFIDAVSITSTDEEAIFYLDHRLVINGTEIFPDEFASRLIFTYASVPPNDRFFDIGRTPAGNGKIEMSLSDNRGVGFQPYKVSVFFRCIQKVAK